MVAALYVQPNGVYAGLPDVDPWDEARDARTYAGPWPVVAHPPCSRWGRYFDGGPAARGTCTRGDNDGCFAAALSAVNRLGGVLEHPEASAAWGAYNIATPPRAGGWVRAGLWQPGWTCCVEQGHYGHRAPKPTWLYAIGDDLPELRWGPCGKRPDMTGMTEAERRRAIKTGICQRLSRKQRAATPPEFRDLLLSIARASVASVANGAGDGEGE